MSARYFVLLLFLMLPKKFSRFQIRRLFTNAFNLFFFLCLGVNTKQLKTLGWFGLTVHFLHALKEFQANDAYFNASDFGDQNFIDILYQAIREAPARDLYLPRVPANLLAGTRSTDHLAEKH